jgi:hypothetical protein
VAREHQDVHLVLGSHSPMPVLHAPMRHWAREGVNNYLVIEARGCPCGLGYAQL